MLKGILPSKRESLAEVASNSSFQNYPATYPCPKYEKVCFTGPKHFFLLGLFFNKCMASTINTGTISYESGSSLFGSTHCPLPGHHSLCFQALLPTYTISKCWQVLRQNVLLSSKCYMKRKKRMASEFTLLWSNCLPFSPSSYITFLEDMLCAEWWSPCDPVHSNQTSRLGPESYSKRSQPVTFLGTCKWDTRLQSVLTGA